MIVPEEEMRMSRSKADCVGITNTGNPWFHFLVTEAEGAPFCTDAI
jgi:hypothetical protein